MSKLKLKLKPGSILFTDGKVAYELMTEVEGGNHGERVLIARRRTAQGVQGEVFLKCVHLPEAVGAHGQKVRARLEEEVRLAEHLRHPGIARVHGLHQVEGTLYVIAECVEGNPLHTLLDLIPDQILRFSDSFILYVGAEVANALAHAHTRTDTAGQPLGIIHRAVDTGRIWITWKGQVQLTDFGLATSRLAGRIASTVRRIHGDVYSSSPEALLGLPVDARADLFQLGLVLCELAAGAHPLDPPRGLPPRMVERLSDAERATVKAAIKNARAVGLEQSVEDVILRAATYTEHEVTELTEPLPTVLRPVVRKLLQREPGARYQTAAEVEAVLRASLDTLGAYGAREAAAELSERLAEVGGALVVVEGGVASMAARRRSQAHQTTR
jgi:serine/threonine protein kinase